MNAQASVHGGCIGAARAEQCMNRLFCQCMRLGLVIAMLTACNDGGGSRPRPAAEIATLELAALESGDGDAVRDRLDDAYPAVWLDSSDLSASRFGEVKFEARDGKHLSAFVYRGTAFDPLDGPIWFVMHGAKRGAKGSLAVAAPIAERHDALAIAIEFSKQAYPAEEDYILGVTYGEPDESAYAEGRWRDPDSYVYSEVEHVFEAVRRSLGGHQEGYYLFGHSAGAQFVHRLITFLPKARVLGAVAANAGWYTLPISGEGAHVAMPYGLRGSPLEHADLRWLFTTPLTVMLGAGDAATPEADPLLRGTVEAMAQGATRLARGRNYFAIGRARAKAIDETFGWRLAIVPRAGHDVTQVASSAGYFLFQSGGPPCRSSPAVAAGGLVINEILADPPGGDRGDANADGVRDASDDEFVEIVNTGTTPVCLAGWTLGDASNAERHVFPLGPALWPGKALVIFGGGVPTGRFGGAEVQWAAFEGRLGLSNAGDVLTLRDAAGTVVKQISWGDCAGEPCAVEHRHGDVGFASSLVRRPELVGVWRVHSDVARSDFSPGTRTDGSVFSSGK
jgi:hypothetical protein